MAGLSPSALLEREQQLKTQISKTPMKFVPGCYAHQHGWYENSNFEEVK
jgi:hypothetical protein